MKTLSIQKQKNRHPQNIEKADIVSHLFQKYEEIGFIYPAKKKLLEPHFVKIKYNWQSLSQSTENLLWIINHQDERINKNFASVSVWKQSNYGLLAQHLVSTGNPFLSLKVMLKAQHKAEHEFDETEVKSSQNWFRPQNRYAYRIFASMVAKLGEEKSSLLLFQYLHLTLKKIKKSEFNKHRITEIKAVDEATFAFVKAQYGHTFARAEELHLPDIQQLDIGSIYQKYGLKKYRKVYKLENKETGKIEAVLIANRNPLGLNFSFLENRAYYILDEKLSVQSRHKVLQSVNNIAKSVYEDFDLQVIPIVTDKVTANVLQAQEAVFQREYMQSIWMREGFAQWYEHIDSFLKRIEKKS